MKQLGKYQSYYLITVHTAYNHYESKALGIVLYARHSINEETIQKLIAITMLTHMENVFPFLTQCQITELVNAHKSKQYTEVMIA